MNLIYKNNMEYLKGINPSLYNKIHSLEVSDVSVVKARDNSPTLIKMFKGREISIHSRYKPKESAKAISEYALEGDSDIIFIIGMGLAYEVKEIIKKNSHKRLFIIEPDSSIFKRTLENTDIKNIFNNKRNLFFIQDDNSKKISEFFNTLIESDKKLKIKFVISPAYEIIYKDLIDNLIEDIRDLMNIYRVNINTYTSSHRAWFQSYVINLKYLKEACPVTKLHSKFKNIPAIIVGAGPSLNFNLEHLKKVGDKAIVVPVGTGITVLEKNNIRGHILGAIDVWGSGEELFSNIDVNKESALFYSSMVYNGVPKIFKKNKFLMNTVEMDYFIKKKLDWKYYNLFSGASVANVIAYNLAQLGCDPIILLGQDFCYSDGKNYAEGAVGYEDLSNDFAQKGYIKVKNVKGDYVYTVPSFISMKQSIEFCIKLNPHVKFMNGNSIGLEIEGAENIDFNEYVDEVFTKSENYDIDRIISSCYDEHMEQMDFKAIDGLISNVGMDINKIINLCKEAIIIVEGSKTKNIKLELLDQIRTKLCNIELYNYVIKDAISNIEYLYSSKDILTNNLNMYSYMLDKVLIMENAYKYEIIEGGEDEKRV